MSDIEIAQQAKLQPIQAIAAKLGIAPEMLQTYGNYKAKLPLTLINEAQVKKGHLILVSAMSPTPAGEGKTTTSIGLAEAMNQIGAQTTVVLREPSLGPVFGMKGGATGGGYAQVLPMEDINLHFTGDFAAIEKAHNLLSALIDNHLQQKNTLGIDPRTIRWKRVMDMNDRALRKVIVGLGGAAEGIPRETGFDITAASEVMAILCFAQGRAHLKEMLGNIFIGYSFDKKPIFAKDLQAQGAMAVLLKDAILPNLVQTIEGNPAIIHGGPFANIAQGTNTVLATKMGLSLSPYVVTEAGFGFDLGGEKFLHLKCRRNGLSPKVVVIVATIRALKYHGGQSLKQLTEPNLSTVEKGFANLARHLSNVRAFGIEPIVALNQFPTDTEAEIQSVIEKCASLQVKAFLSSVWAKGGAGAIEIAHEVLSCCQAESQPFQPLYPERTPILDQLKLLATRLYGASSVVLSQEAEADLKQITALGYGELPICVAKTQKSFSENEKMLGAPEGHQLNVRRIELASGAGFVVPLIGNMLRMPGLPAEPAALNIDIDDDGKIFGLF
jgi:formate--tetrahydrofolate ligase